MAGMLLAYGTAARIPNGRWRLFAPDPSPRSWHPDGAGQSAQSPVHPRHHGTMAPGGRHLLPPEKRLGGFRSQARTTLAWHGARTCSADTPSTCDPPTSSPPSTAARQGGRAPGRRHVLGDPVVALPPRGSDGLLLDRPRRRSARDTSCMTAVWSPTAPPSACGRATTACSSTTLARRRCKPESRWATAVVRPECRSRSRRRRTSSRRLLGSGRERPLRARSE